MSEHEVGTGLRARKLDDGDGTVCVLAIGKMVEAAQKAALSLAERGRPVTVWDVRCCAPLDEDMLADAASHRAVVTIEDGIRDGGVGMTIADRLHDLDPTVTVEMLGVPIKFIPHGSQAHILAGLGLDADGLVRTITDVACR